MLVLLYFNVMKFESGTYNNWFENIAHGHAKPEKPNRTPVAAHWWGVYKYEVTGRDVRTAAWQEGDQLIQLHADFYEKFIPDWFHLHVGTPRYFRDSEVFLCKVRGC
jgi:hypothetical protein